MADELKGRRVAFLATDGVERVELLRPREAVENAGASVELLSLKTGDIQSMDGDLTPSGTFSVDRAVGEARIDEYALVIPGGTVNADRLRMDDGAMAFVRNFAATGQPMGVICHGPWTLVESGVAKGRTLTSFPSLRTDVENAGGHWVDKEVVTDNGLVTSRTPDDLPAFCAKIVEEFVEGRHAPRAVSSGAAAA